MQFINVLLHVVHVSRPRPEVVRFRSAFLRSRKNNRSTGEQRGENRRTGEEGNGIPRDSLASRSKSFRGGGVLIVGRRKKRERLTGMSYERRQSNVAVYPCVGMMSFDPDTRVQRVPVFEREYPSSHSSREKRERCMTLRRSWLPPGNTRTDRDYGKKRSRVLLGEEYLGLWGSWKVLGNCTVFQNVASESHFDGWSWVEQHSDEFEVWEKVDL